MEFNPDWHRLERNRKAREHYRRKKEKIEQFKKEAEETGIRTLTDLENLAEECRKNRPTEK